MELSSATSVALAVVAVLVAAVLRSFVSSWNKALKLPPGPRGWPVIGSLGALAGTLPPHRALAALSARYGELMYLRLGSCHVVVASSANAARLILKTHDHALADRPPTKGGEVASYGCQGITFTPYGAYWRMARKLCATELFSARRMDSFEHIRVQELRALVRSLFDRAGTAVTLREYLPQATMRNILRTTVGEKWSGGSIEAEAFGRALDKLFEVSSSVRNVGEFIPWLGWLDLQGYVRRMKKLRELFDRFYEQILEEHEERRREAGTGEFLERDLVDVLLQRAKEDTTASEARLTRDGVKAFIQDMILGGTESSAVTTEWAMSELLRRPETMAKATEELDRIVGRERWVTESDLPDLPYISAVVKETMRLHPIATLLVPHYAREDTVVDGYDFPAGTRVLVNVWAIGRDPASWPDAPDAFRPERFLDGGSAHGVDVRGVHFELLPFGAGRRMCPGYNLGLKMIMTGLANLVQGFAWRLPDGMMPKDVSMEEQSTLSTRPKVPLIAVGEARLPAHLYVDTE